MHPFKNHNKTRPKNQTHIHTEDIPVWSGIGPSFSAARLVFMLLSPLVNEYCSIVLELQWLCSLLESKPNSVYVGEYKICPVSVSELQTSSPAPGGCLCLTVKYSSSSSLKFTPFPFPNPHFSPESLDLHQFHYYSLSFTNE